MNELAIIELFCLIDDSTIRFRKTCAQEKIEHSPQKKRVRECRTCLSEVMTILLLFHRSGYRTFKHFYPHCVRIHLNHLFSNLVGYSRFVQLTSEAFFPMFCFTKEHQGICEPQC